MTSEVRATAPGARYGAAMLSVSFPDLLRRWRTERRVSQSHLAEDAEVSARHISFLETGRARPSREMVLVLASALEVPLRERNELLAAAGFAAAYPARAVEAEEMAPIRRAVDRMLRQQEPFPAVVLDRRWNVLQTNEAGARLFALLLDEPPAPPTNLLRVMFDPRGARPWVVQWEHVAASLLHRIHREAVGGVLDADTRALLDEILPLAPPSAREGRIPVGELPVIPVHFRRGELDLRFFSAVVTFGTPRDVTAEELRIECFYPEDAATEARARALLG